MESKDFAGRMLPGERLEWTGTPYPGLMLGKQDFFLIPFSLLWFGFAIFWEWNVAQSGADLFMTLWGIPFLVIGLYAAFGRFAHDAWARRRTRYAVTDQRILILRLSPFTRFTALPLAQLPEVSLEERRDGRGNIHFAAQSSFWTARNSLEFWAPSLGAMPSFLGIAKARQVFDRVQILTQAAGRRAVS